MIIRTVTFILILLFAVIGIMSLEQSDPELIWNATETALEKTYQNVSQSFVIVEDDESFGGLIKNIIYKIVDTVMYVSIQLARLTSRLAIENPDVNFRAILYLLFFALVLTVALPLLKICVIVGILLIDMTRHFKEKRRIRKLRYGTNP